MARRIQEEWNLPTPSRDILLYKFEGVITYTTRKSLNRNKFYRQKLISYYND